MNLSNISTEDLKQEIRSRIKNTHLEDAEWDTARGRCRSSLSSQLLQSIQVGEVKRLYHHDIYCYHRIVSQHSYECGLGKARDSLKRKGITFHIYHEAEHIAIVARIS